MRRLAPVAVTFALACSCSCGGGHIVRPVDVEPEAASAPEATPTFDVQSGESRYEGFYETVEPRPNQMLQTTLELVKLDDGKDLVISYSADPKNASLKGKRVVVIGTVYVPEGRAIGGTHIKARILSLAPTH